MKKIIFSILLSIICSAVFSQKDSVPNIFTTFGESVSTELYTTATNEADSISLWSYEIIQKEDYSKDSNLICTILFFRNVPIEDSIYEKKHDEKYTPSMSFKIYPISCKKRIAKEEFQLRMISNCIFIGNNDFKTKNFIFYHKNLCNNCYASNFKSDYCRKNINKLIPFINQKEYSSFEELLLDLPIKRENAKIR